MISLFVLLVLGGSLVVGAAAIAAALVWYILLAIGRWRMFEKMGEAGWKGFIPLYADYILYKRCWQPTFFWVSLAAALVSGVGENQEQPNFLSSAVGLVGTAVDAVQCWKISKAFGHGLGFTLGLIFLNPFFMLYLGLGPDRYLGPQ